MPNQRQQINNLARKTDRLSGLNGHVWAAFGHSFGHKPKPGTQRFVTMDRRLRPMTMRDGTFRIVHNALRENEGHSEIGLGGKITLRLEWR